MEGTPKVVLYLFAAVVVILAVTSEANGKLQKKITWSGIGESRRKRSEDNDMEDEGPDAIDFIPVEVNPTTYRRYVFGLKGPREEWEPMMAAAKGEPSEGNEMQGNARSAKAGPQQAWAWAGRR